MSASPGLIQPAVKQTLKVAFFSCGLGNINRGFEISTARFFRALKQESELDVRLYSGGHYEDAIKVWTISRNSWLKAFPFFDNYRRWKLSYVCEQVSFAFGMLGHCTGWQPSVVWTKEVPLAHILYEFRRLRNLPYKIIFANGGGFQPKTYQQFDFIQHIQPEAYEEALKAGIPGTKMNVLPNIVPYIVPTPSKIELRRTYGYEPDDWIIVCAAAWNRHHKRIDYLINEVTQIKNPKCKLLLCGQPEPEGEPLKKLAWAKLGSRVKWLTLPEHKVCEALKLADIFVLPSLYEGLGTVLVEAALSGLPIICHPHAGGQFILQDEYWMADLSKPGKLAERLHKLHSTPVEPWRLQSLQSQVANRFSQNQITNRFLAMLRQVTES